MFYYRYPGRALGFRILMIILLIAGGTFLARSAFQAGYLQGTGVEGGEITTPVFIPHMKGYAHPVLGGSMLTVLAIFLGGVLLIKLISSVVGLVMFNRWRKEGGLDWDDWKAAKFHGFHHPPVHCGPHHPMAWGWHPGMEKPRGEDQSQETSQDSD